MSYQQQEFSAPGGPVRRESALQRQMAEFDAKKSVSYSEGTREGSSSPNSKSSKRNGTPYPKAGGPHAPPSPEREQGFVAPSRKNTHHSPPRSDDEGEYIKNIRKTGGNGRDTEEKWVGNDLPRPRVHGADENETDMSLADNLRVTGGRGKDQTVEWNGDEAPAITTHHVWTDDEPQSARKGDEDSAPRKKNPKSKKYKNADGDYVEEADGSDNEVNAHHVWRPDSEAQANYKPEKSKKSKKSSRRSSHEENDRPQYSGDEEEGGTRTYIDRNGDEVVEASNPDNLKIGHNHTWTD